MELTRSVRAARALAPFLCVRACRYGGGGDVLQGQMLSSARPTQLLATTDFSIVRDGRWREGNTRWAAPLRSFEMRSDHHHMIHRGLITVPTHSRAQLTSSAHGLHSTGAKLS